MRFWSFIIGTSLLGTSLILGGIFFIIQHQWVDFSVLEHYDPGTPSIVLDDEGNEWTRFQLDRRDPIPLTMMPKNLIHAFTSTEDRHFFSHHGISLKGIVRSIFVNLKNRKIIQGASTITQQLVKLLFFNHERTFIRKIKEQFLTLIVERQFTKEQIIETYLNHVCFGSGIYGAQAAAQRFWNTSAEKLSTAQCATLAAIVRAPNNYCPLYERNQKRALKRRNLVLWLMKKHNHISHDEYLAALNEPLMQPPEKQTLCGAHVREMVRLFLENLVGKKNLYTEGLTIKTTLNQSMQNHAENTFKKHVTNIRHDIANINGALVAIDTQTAGIKALVGGYQSFHESPFNRAIQAQRQMGSIFKPLIYAAALETGKNFSETIVDEPIVIGSWKPRNVTRRFDGTMTLAHALASSNNMIPIKLLLEIGVDKVIDIAKRCQLPGPFPPYASLALGCTECSTIQAAAYFNIFVNKGTYKKPYAIEWIKNRWGKKIWKQRSEPIQVIPWHISSQIVQTLKLVTQSLRKRMPNWWIKNESIGKTGTTNDNRTCWFAGSTPDYTTVIYLGCDNNESMQGSVYSVRQAVPIWLEFNRSIPTSETTFYHDPQLQKQTIHRRTGEILFDENNKNGIKILTKKLQTDQP